MLRTISHILSYLFHPIFLIPYGLGLLYLVNPYLFSIQNEKAFLIFFLYIFLLSVFFPVLSISLMKTLGFIKSFRMAERTDRIGPLITTAIFYLWLFLNIYRNPGIPLVFSIFVLGSIVAIFIAFFINNFSKISLHSVGMGGMLAACLIIKEKFSYNTFPLDLGSLGAYIVNMNLVVIVLIIVAGLVGTSRLILDAHKIQDIYGGFIVGAFAQIISFIILYN